MKPPKISMKGVTPIIKWDIYVGDSYSIRKKKTVIGERSKNDRWYTLSKFFVLFLFFELVNQNTTAKVMET